MGWLYGLVLLILSVVQLPAPSNKTPLFNDKVFHGIAYFLLAWILYRGFIRPGGPLWLSQRAGTWAFSIAVCYGAALEWLQSQIPWRHAEAMDIVANASGAGVALIVVLIWPRER